MVPNLIFSEEQAKPYDPSKNPTDELGQSFDHHGFQRQPRAIDIAAEMAAKA